ncbi:MAG: transporter [Sphingobacteriales bacterium 17-39-43]|uniref:TolC family protein n=1 Tax=Daejeonella sp. TaxID=2805397 RepID=UPI000BC6C485|nr:TolC family protein [Daejeonella sp.]OYZ32811.1 MAG: transporter [Sphingobacteriales bacterium 16-39-50]OZA26221.1 MAG: transporter [Sphingobacteriales bacterium 17-39-43]HQT23165.1 TolC family protein [Daejeonella sp.]HQT56076.1 TolC family protein [Daejeonella sp.]
MKYKYLTLILCLFSITDVRAQLTDTVAHFSLQEAIEYAQRNQSSIQNAKIDEEIAANTVKQTVGIGLPQVNGSVNFQDFLKVPTNLVPGEIFGQPGKLLPVQFGVKYQSSFGLELNQLLFDGTYLVGLQASKTYKELSSKSLKRSRIETAVAVTKAYYSVLVSNEQLNLLDANMLRLKKSLDDTKALYKNGFVEKIDVDRLTVLNNNLETERENVIRLLDLNVNLLKFQMGMSIQSKLTLKDSIAGLQVVQTFAVSDTSAYKNRIEYSLLETQKKLNELDLKRYKSQFLPSLSAFGNTSQNLLANSFGSLFDRSFPTTIIGFRLSVPLISGGIKLYQVRNAKLEILKTHNNLINLKNGIRLEVEQAQTTYRNGLKSLENQNRNMELAQEVLRVTKIKYEQGVGSSIEVTTAETSLKEAQNNYINALYDLLINKVNMDKASGKIVY